MNTGASTTDQVLHSGATGTIPLDFVAPLTTDLWEFPTLPVAPAATLPTGTAAPGQWVQYGTSASGGGVSSTTGMAIDPSIVATGTGASAVQYVAWADNRNGVYQIFVAKESSSGWAELAGSAHGGGISNGSQNSLSPSITLNAAGNPVVAWVEGGDIDVAIYSSSANSGAGGWVALGTSLSAGGISNTGDASAPQIVNTSAGPVVAWFDSSGGFSNVFVRQFNGTSWIVVGAGSASGGGVSASNVSVAQFSLATDGTSVAVDWTQSATTAGSSIYLLKNSGSGWSALNGSAAGTGISGAFRAIEPTIAFAGGSLYVAWAAKTDGTFNIVAAVNSGSGWQSLAIDTPVSAGAAQVSRGAASDPVLSANGAALDLVWFEDRLPGTPDQAVAIYADRLSGGAFVRQLPGDASFDGILARSTSLSQPTSLTLAVDAAGHPFVAWGDSSSGSSQIYMLGDTLDIHQIIYVNDLTGPNDTYTTKPGQTIANGGSGLTPASPLLTLIEALSIATSPNDVILVDSGTYAGFTVGSANNGVLILGSPDGSTIITSGVSVASAQSITLQGLQLTGGAILTGDTNVTLKSDVGGSIANLAMHEGGGASLTGDTNLLLDSDSLVGVIFSGSASSNVTVENSLLPGTGLAINGTVTGLLASGNRVSLSPSKRRPRGSSAATTSPAAAWLSTPVSRAQSAAISSTAHRWAWPTTFRRRSTAIRSSATISA